MDYMEMIKYYIHQAFSQDVIDVVKEAFVRAGGTQLICALAFFSFWYIKNTQMKELKV